MGEIVKADIITVGNELVSGDVQETNGRFLIGRLRGIGVKTARISVVGDEDWAICDVLENAFRSHEIKLIILTGGLGPTRDDITSRSVAKVTGKRLVFSDEVLAHIRETMESRGEEMHPSQEKQALIPQKAKVLKNPGGTACAYTLHHHGKIIAVLPGIPSEVRLITDQLLLAEIESELHPQKSESVKKIHVLGLPETKIEEMISPDLRDIAGLQVAFLPSPTQVTLSLVAEGAGAEKIVSQAADAISERLGNYIFAEGDGSLEETTGNLLQLRRKTLSLAESCTGGGIGEKITRIPGCSAYFHMGFVTYSNEAKSKLLDIDPALIDKYGAVSKEVAAAMAQGARKIGRADFGLAVTGIAGPEGGSEDKPVGTVYVALSSDEHTMAKRFSFSGDRAEVRERAKQAALEFLRRKLVTS
ncbi:MAG: competence/damage-inducible protein A [Proteobacteria bacterium]|nr:competence/damage-inducible protein A [Pseudomonadota bacterium]